jgi:hypothetical protein
MRKGKCGICKKKGKIIQSWFMREGWRWGANPPYKFVTDFSTRYLCEECLKLPIKLTSVSWKVYPIRLEE